jgi:hypothetical protein
MDYIPKRTRHRFPITAHPYATHKADADGAATNTPELGTLSGFDIGDLVYNGAQDAVMARDR